MEVESRLIERKGSGVPGVPPLGQALTGVHGYISSV